MAHSAAGMTGSRAERIRLRRIAADDEAVLFELFASVRGEELALDGCTPEDRQKLVRFQFEAQQRGYRTQYPAADWEFIVREQSPVGWLIADRRGPVVRCLDIAVVAGERCRGAGTLAMEMLQKEAAALARPVSLKVSRLNLRAMAFYERLGFRKTGETDLHRTLEWHP
jgi:ribosomal protein S18 acetylase RimI-like enzyme